MDTNIKIRQLREAKGLTHKDMADRINIARSTYSKYESGKTEMNMRTAFNISKALNVPINAIINDESISDEFAHMLFLMDYQLHQHVVRVIPYADLKPEHIELLRKKGLDSQDAYEATPLKGRIYEFSPEKVFGFMIECLGMGFLFTSHLVTDEYWINCWKDYLKEDRRKFYSNNEIEIDDTDYCTSYSIRLTMADGQEKWLEYADRDCPVGEDGYPDESKGLEYLIDTFGAKTGDIMCFSYCGYHPLREMNNNFPR